MAQINNLERIQQDITVNYFNNFFASDFAVTQNIDDTTIGYFERITANKTSARALAGAVIYTAKMQNLDPMAILQKFSALPAGQLNNYLSIFLNLNRIGTSLLGINNAPITSKYISRAILP